MDDRPPVPTPGAIDRFKTATEIGVSLIPYVGGSLALSLDVMIPSTLTRRREHWDGWVDRSLRELLDHGLDPEALSEDERFVTAVLQTTRIAVGTHIEEKLRLLAGCLTSVALDPPTDFLTDRFLRWVDELRVEHFDELASHDYRGDDLQRHTDRIVALTEGQVDRTARLLAEQDLVREGLLIDEDPGRSPAASPKLRISPLGTQLIDFVRYMTEDDEAPDT